MKWYHLVGGGLLLWWLLKRDEPSKVAVIQTPMDFQHPLQVQPYDSEDFSGMHTGGMPTAPGLQSPMVPMDLGTISPDPLDPQLAPFENGAGSQPGEVEGPGNVSPFHAPAIPPLMSPAGPVNISTLAAQTKQVQSVPTILPALPAPTLPPAPPQPAVAPATALDIATPVIPTTLQPPLNPAPPRPTPVLRVAPISPSPSLLQAPVRSIKGVYS